MIKDIKRPNMEKHFSDNSLEPLLWNTSSHHQHYASLYPYTILDEVRLEHILNFTKMKSDIIVSNATSFNFNSEVNSNYNDTDYECNVEHAESGWFSTEFQATLHFMYITIFVIAILGNAMVIFIVCQSSRMQTVTNYFIANLAVADMSMAFFCIPFSFISQFVLQYWPFGSILCKIVNYTQAISVLVSAYTLVAISIDRYIAIMFPLKPRLSKRYAKLIISIVWVVAFATASPIPIVSTIIQPTVWYVKCNRHFCLEIWDEKYYKDYYSFVLMSFQFIIPLAVLIFTYTRIAVVVWGKKPPGEAENLRDLRMARSKRKMIKMMLAVVFAFIFCWLPFNLFMLLGHEESTNNPLLPYLWFAFHWLAMSHSCYNPIIYGLMNSRFKACFIAVLYRIPGFQRFFSRRLRGTRERYPNNNGESIFLALNHQSCITKSNRIVKNDDYYNADVQANGFEENSHLHRMNTSTTYISTRRKQQQQQNLTGKIAQKVETSCFCDETSVQR